VGKWESGNQKSEISSSFSFSFSSSSSKTRCKIEDEDEDDDEDEDENELVRRVSHGLFSPRSGGRAYSFSVQNCR